MKYVFVYISFLGGLMFVDACTTIDFPFISSSSSPPIPLVSFFLVLVKITSWKFLTTIILLNSTCNRS